MSIEQTRAVFEAFKASCNERWLDVDAMVSLFSDEAADAMGGRETLRRTELNLRGAFPEMSRAFQRVVIGEDGFAMVSRLSGENTGPVFGHEATGKALDIETTSFCSVRDGLIRDTFVSDFEGWMAEFYRQLGLPNPSSPGAAARAMLQRVFEDSNKSPKDMSFILDLYAPRFMRNGVEVSAETWRRVAEGIYAAFPDATQDLLDVTMEGDRIFCRYVMRGTHTGDLVLADRRIPATGRRFEVWGMEMRRVRDGKFVELWTSDTLSQLLPQLEGR